MSYTAITSSLYEAKKAAIQRLFTRIAANFSDHQSRINALEISANPIPVGTICHYGGGSVPSGFLLCDGSEVSRNTYASLYARIGDTWGAGDGGSTFNLPDIRNRVSIGNGAGDGLTSRTVGQTLGANTHALTTGEIPSHTHTMTDPGHSHGFSDTGTGSGSAYRQVRAVATGTNFNDFDAISPEATGITVDNAGSGTAHNNMQPYLAVTRMIRF